MQSKNLLCYYEQCKRVHSSPSSVKHFAEHLAQYTTNRHCCKIWNKNSTLQTQCTIRKKTTNIHIFLLIKWLYEERPKHEETSELIISKLYFYTKISKKKLKNKTEKKQIVITELLKKLWKIVIKTNILLALVRQPKILSNFAKQNEDRAGLITTKRERTFLHCCHIFFIIVLRWCEKSERHW